MRQLAYLFLLLLYGCKSVYLTKTYPAPSAPGAHAIKQWLLQGYLGIKTPDYAISANIAWLQTQGFYRIQLWGPLGMQRILLQNNRNGVELKDSQGKTWLARNPEDLLQKQLGWQLPVTNLYYWIRGLEAPNIPAKRRFDVNQRLVFLQQQGWDISYLSYQKINDLELPTRIRITNPRLQVNTVIYHWEFSQ